MPHYVVDALARALDQRQGRALSRSRILIIGLAYKKNVPDIRESPSFKLMDLLQRRGAAIGFHDPHVPKIPRTREYSQFYGWESAPLNAGEIDSYDAVL